MENIKNSLFLSCLKATGFIEKKQAIGLNFTEEIQLKIHLSMCKACAAYVHQSRAIEEGLIKNYKKKDVSGTEDTLDQFEKEIKEKIKSL